MDKYNHLVIADQDSMVERKYTDKIQDDLYSPDIIANTYGFVVTRIDNNPVLTEMIRLNLDGVITYH